MAGDWTSYGGTDLEMFASPLLSASKVVVVAASLWWRVSTGSASSGAAVGDILEAPALSGKRSAKGGEVFPGEWTEMTMVLDEGTKRKAVMIRNGSDDDEVTVSTYVQRKCMHSDDEPFGGGVQEGWKYTVGGRVHSHMHDHSDNERCCLPCSWYSASSTLLCSPTSRTTT